jgi:CheY-like chemotaxis protein
MSEKGIKERIPILLIEDDEDDIKLTQRAFKKGRILNKMYVVRDGEEAIEFLKHTGRYTNEKDAPRPGIILLDLNMPRMDGRAVLRIVKQDKQLHRIPIIVLTTSDSYKDVVESYEQGANTFVTKPLEFDKFLNAVTTLGRFWLSIAEVPAEETVLAGVGEEDQESLVQD